MNFDEQELPQVFQIYRLPSGTDPHVSADKVRRSDTAVHLPTPARDELLYAGLRAISLVDSKAAGVGVKVRETKSQNV